MEQWVDIAAKNGLSVLVVIGLAWFFYKRVWPIMEKRMVDADVERTQNLVRWEDQRREHTERWERQGKLFTDALRYQEESQARRFEEQGKMFMDALRSRDILAAEAHRDWMKAQNQMASELKTLSSYIRNGSGLGRLHPGANDRKQNG